MNKILKTLAFDDQMSLAVLETTDMVNEAIRLHKLSPLSAAALGRAITVSTFAASTLKNDGDKLYVNINGDGVGGRITVCGNGKLQMRGSIVNPDAYLPLTEKGKLDVGGCVGRNGRITVVRSMGLKEPYSGTAELVNGEIAEDFTAYYAYSEQIPTAISLGVRIGKDLKCEGAGGVVLQALPGAEEKNLIRAEEIIRSLSGVSAEIAHIGAEGVIKKYFGIDKYQIFYPEYKCLCSRERIESVIVSLGRKEAEDIIAKEGAIKVKCEFCEREYSFYKEDLGKIFGG